ncbi:MAG TPA: DUF1572 family protein [Terriglobales bacterium]|nr:DUF1572 family protein [Terriglobales bacterium]
MHSSETSSPPQVDVGSVYLEDVLRNLRSYKKLAEEAFAQTSDEDMFRLIDSEANSIAMLVKHMAGNMRSRWTDFLTSDGEKPDRHRDREFEIEPGTTRAQVMQWWEQGWKYVFDAIEPLKPEDVTRTVYIAGREHSVLQAISRQLLHYGGHVNQIVLLAKHFRGPEWKSLSIPKGQSETFARQFEQKHAARAET